MYKLAEIQREFQKYILMGNLNIENEIVNTKKVLASQRLEIYRDGYYLRLLEVLASDYPVLRDLMGCEQFDQLGRRYIDTYTSRYRSVRWFGKYLADFLKQTNSSFEALSWQSELALFEWSLTEAFDAPNSTVLRIEEMAAVLSEKWSAMRFRLQPSLRRVETYWNIAQLWQAFKENQKINDQKNIMPQKLDKLEALLIWRKEYQIKFCVLSIEQKYMINAILENNNFGHICSGLCQWMDPQQVVIYAAQYLKTLIADGVITECIVE